MDIKKTAIAAVTAAYLALTGCATPPKPYSSIELMGGHEASTLDVKVGGELAPRVGAFARTRVKADYETGDETVKALVVGSLTLNMVDGLDVVVGGKASPSFGVHPRSGLQYFKKIGDLKIFGQATIKTLKEPDYELLGKLVYCPKLTDDVGLDLGVEGVVDLDKDGRHTYSTIRGRPLFDISGWKIGPMVDLEFVGRKGKFGYNIGGGIRKDF
jgi:hypothetical protein